MEDREMLELAAKACGYTVHGSINDRFIVNFGEGMRGEWNPLKDDGDALRLAVRLGIPIEVDYGVNEVIIRGQFGIALGNDPDAATRRAITRAAAEKGKQEGN